MSRFGRVRGEAGRFVGRTGRVRRSPQGEGGCILRNSRRDEEGFTLLEVMVVVVILGLLATVLITQISGKIEIAQREASKAQIKQIESAVEEFKLFGKKYPETLEDLVRRPGDYKGTWPEQGFLRGGEVPKDPWGNDYIYRRNSPGTVPRYEIISYGADGAEGGSDENEDLSSYQPNKNK